MHRTSSMELEVSARTKDTAGPAVCVTEHTRWPVVSLHEEETRAGPELGVSDGDRHSKN